MILRPSCEGDEGARKIYVESPETLDDISKSQTQIFPNPAQEKITIQSTLESDELYIEIKDLSGRIVMNQNVLVKGFITTLGIKLINGSYLIYLYNKSNECSIKKLLISK